MIQRELQDYLVELADIRNKLSDFLDRIRQGYPEYYKDIALKLRILYCRKSGTEPLLRTIEDLLGVDILVLVRLTMKEKVDIGVLPPSLANGLVFEQINSVVTWLERGDAVLSVFTALDRPEVLAANRTYSYRDIIEVAADKLGGAHVDPKIPAKDLALHSQNLLIGGLPVAQRALFDTARATVQLLDCLLHLATTGAQYPFLRPRPSGAQ